MDHSIRLNVFGRQVLAVRSEDGWQMFYSSADGKRRPAVDIMVPAFVTESEIVSFMADLCHEWVTQKHPEVRRIDREINLKIRYEKPQDISAIRRVNEAAFETGTESDLVDALRDKKAHIISMVAEKENRIIGHILFSPVTLTVEGSEITLLGLAPMAVFPEYQKQGIGSKLVEDGLEESRRKGYPAVVVLGHPDYYPRFGFVPSQKYNITSEYDVPPEVFMVLELQPGALSDLSGIAKYHGAFAEL